MATVSGGRAMPCRERVTRGSEAASSAVAGLAGKVQPPLPRLAATAPAAPDDQPPVLKIVCGLDAAQPRIGQSAGGGAG